MSPQFQNPLIDLLKNTNFFRRFLLRGRRGGGGGLGEKGDVLIYRATKKRAICFAKLQQNGLNSDIDRLNGNKSNLLNAFYRSLRGLIGDGCLKEMIVLKMRLHVYLPAPSQPG